MAVQFPVSEAKANALREWMTALGIMEKDLDESFIRSGGSGGQHVNKVSTCVVLRHLPSGHEIKCQDSRSQGMNRYYARKRLCMKIEEEQLGKKSTEQQKREKIRRQKRRRSRRAKEKMLVDKKHAAKKKNLRKKPSTKPD